MLKAKVDIAVAIISLLKQKNKRMPVHEMSNELNLSISALEQVLYVIKKYGIVASRKGHGGGFLLDDYKNFTIRDLTVMFYPHYEKDNSVKYFTKKFLDIRLWYMIK